MYILRENGGSISKIPDEGCGKIFVNVVSSRVSAHTLVMISAGIHNFLQLLILLYCRIVWEVTVRIDNHTKNDIMFWL